MIFFGILLLIIIHLHQATAAEILFGSPVGAYEMQWKELGSCPPGERGTNEIFTDLHITKRHQGMTEIAGRNIFLVPFDDNVTITFNFATLGSNWAWLPKVYTLPFTKGCSTMAGLLQDSWVEFLKIMGMVPKCPLAKGIYEVKGYDLNKMVPSNSPVKEFLFGRYKITIEYARFRKLIGCTYAIVQIIPKWQRRTKNKNEQ